MRIIDLYLNIDGLILDDSISIDDFIDSIQVNSIYPIVYKILNEERYDE